MNFIVGELYINFKNNVRRKKEAAMTTLLSDKVDTIVTDLLIIVKNWEQPKTSQYVNGQTNCGYIHTME